MRGSPAGARSGDALNRDAARESPSATISSTAPRDQDQILDHALPRAVRHRLACRILSDRVDADALIEHAATESAEA